MQTNALFHQPFGAYAFPVAPHTLCVRLRAARGDLQSAHVLYADRYSPLGQDRVAAMNLLDYDSEFDYFQAFLTLPQPRFRYLFHLDDGRSQVWYSQGGVLSNPPNTWHRHFEYAFIMPANLYSVPEWAKHAVFYSIFPDRFANGDPANDPPGCHPWRVEPGEDEPAVYRSFFGGDLEGIIQRLPYLQELGVTALYLTPIFLSPSVHKYDTTDYYQIDRHFGDLETAGRLVDRCHAAGMRVVLDAVFNHCGQEFFAFQDVLKRGARSPYLRWFELHGLPVQTDPPNYTTFANGVSRMPKLMTANPEVRLYLLQVARYWTQTLGIDGWRLDVANEVDPQFWREFRQTVRSVNPDALIVGEVMTRADAWLQGDQFDSVMNYPFRQACLDFFATDAIRADEFAARLARLRAAYASPVHQVLWNLLDSHDTPRFRTECREAAKRQGGAAVGHSRDRQALAAILQLTYEGAPLIYYGDEVGMEGGGDPDCRRPMIWEESRQDQELLTLYRRLLALRKELPALRCGFYRALVRDGLRNVFAFWRGPAAEGGEPYPAAGPQVVVVLNNHPLAQQVEVPLPQEAGCAAASGQWQVEASWPLAAREAIMLPETGAAASGREAGEPQGARMDRLEPGGAFLSLQMPAYGGAVLVRRP